MSYYSPQQDGPIASTSAGAPTGEGEGAKTRSRSNSAIVKPRTPLRGSPTESTAARSLVARPHSPRQDAAVGSSSKTSALPASPARSPASSKMLGEGSSSRGTQLCAKCNLAMTGQFVRALGLVFHLDCFLCDRCSDIWLQDCGKVVAAKFFPIDGPDGKQKVLCETDYFRRLNLLCASCGCALRGSYITALDKKFHTEHFTCSVCTTVFGPQDSYYEHQGNVYCHFHYSCRFAVKCTGCNIAILKQFVEINRNNQDEHWHPECYMIHKFWNTKLAPSPPLKLSVENVDTAAIPSATEAEWLAQEASETPESLRERQRQVEEQVYRIWTVLSTFEESSAACISEMLRQVSSGQFLEGVEMAEKFVIHVETLFAGIDDLASHCRAVHTKEFSHVREARMLCKKVVSFFSLLSQSHETGPRKMGITQELLSLVTGLAHYLKILIRIALTAALRLEREFDRKSAMSHFLNRLDRLARDPDSIKPANAVSPISSNGSPHSPNASAKKARPYGYKSLQRGLGTMVAQTETATDLCEYCRATIEEECARFGTNRRWHLVCLRCSSCGRGVTGREKEVNGLQANGQPSTLPLHDFRLVESNPGSAVSRNASRVFCYTCAPPSSTDSFESVTRLEQYAFLLCVALNKLYNLLKQRRLVSQSGGRDESTPLVEERPPLHDAYRDSADVKRMKSVNLDRKLSTTARLPQRSTVIESPAGRQAQVSEERNLPEGAEGLRSPPATYATLPGEVSYREGQRPRTARDPLESAPSGAQTPLRPTLPRQLTEVKVVDERLDLLSPREEIRQHPLGDHRIQNEDGITLADLPQVMEVEQAKEQQRPLVRQTQMTLLSELSALEYMIVKHVAALTLAGDQSPIRDLLPSDEIMELLDEGKKNNFWGKLFKGGNDRSKVKKKGVFGIALESLVERSGADSMLGAGAAPVRVPAFIDDLLSAMRQMDMSIEGVFRKNGNIRRLKDLSDALDRDVGGVNLVDDNPVQLAALLKKFLRELPDPLLSFKLHNLFVATQRIEVPEERLRMLHLVSCLLPKAHRDTMEVIFVFLKWVASFSHIDEETGSKMDLHNLATVICPNILYAKGKDPTKDESFLAIRAIQELLEYQDIFWQVPEELSAVLNDQDLFVNPEALTSKAILKRCQEYASRISMNRHARYSPSSGTSPSRSTRGAVQPQHPHVHDGLPTLPSSTFLPQFPTSPGHQRPLSANGFSNDTR